MNRRRSLFWFTALALSAAGAPARAQDSLESIIKSATLSRTQRATMEAEISVRVKRLPPAWNNPDRREEIRDKLVRTAQVKGASKAGLDAYAEICADELKPLLADEHFEVAQDAILVLTTLDNPNTVSAFAKGLESPFAAIRLMAARGIQALHKKLADAQSECEDALSALGRAGAAERNKHVLRVIYQAVNFPSDVRNFKYADASAAALNTIFEGRLQHLATGSRDDQRDEVGWTAAGDCYAGAGNDQKVQLMRNMVAFLDTAIDRFFDPNTGDESFPALADAIDRIETIIHGMMKQSNATPPARLAGRFKGRIADRTKLEPEVRTSLKSLLDALQKDPWKMP